MKAAYADPVVTCPICSSNLVLIPLSNILLGYPPYHCEQCDIQWHEEDVFFVHNVK